MEDKVSKGWPWLIICTVSAGLISVFFAICVVWVYLSHFPSAFSEDQEKWGQFGDYIGGLLNPFFSVMAFFALLYTIRQQSKTITLQSIEMANSTAQLEKSAYALQEQNRYNDDAQFDARLFGLLELHQNITSALEVHEITFGLNGSDALLQRKAHAGIKAISYLWKGFLDLQLSRVSRGDYPNMDLYDAINVEFKAWNSDDAWKQLGRYIKSLSNILEYVALSRASEDRVKFSLNLIRSNLTQDEQNLLFYFAAFSNFFKGSMALIVSGRLLVEVDARDPFLAHRADFIHIRSQKQASR